jgi:hypothetical protein
MKQPSLIGRAFSGLIHAADRAVGWHRLPLPLSLLSLIAIRQRLRLENLHDTATPASSPSPAPPIDGRRLTVRTIDGTYNDLTNPTMGSANTRFGRNVPIDQTHPEVGASLLTPNPRLVSRELLTRDVFQPATTLNVLAAAWLQFMIRDWFSHGPSPKENPWRLQLADDDPWHERPMTILRVRPDPTRTPAERGYPPTYANTETHWWDGSQIYGSTAETQKLVRTGEGGKLRVDPNGLLPADLLAAAGTVAGWWLGLGLLQIIFTREHNAICDRLRAAYPNWSDDDLFERARLVNAALLAKIHTVEWTTAILGSPTMRIGMRANWWGIAGERVSRLFGRLSRSEVISGIVGGPTDHFGVPYAITEEFVAVYRMHPLLPDDFTFRAATDDRLITETTFPKLAGPHAQTVLHETALADLLYSFGIAHPGAVVLHNFPRFLQRFERPDGVVIDLAATDILRSRELGVPRYTAFRNLLHLPPVRSFEQLTDNPAWREEIRRVYDGDIDRVDLTVVMFAEPLPKGFGFSDTAFRIFALMASRRLNSDRFFTVDFTPRVYTPEGIAWIADNDMSSVLLRHLPGLAPALRGVNNAFAPWSRVA